jgi:hypothetical protein
MMINMCSQAHLMHTSLDIYQNKYCLKHKLCDVCVSKCTFAISLLVFEIIT